MRTTSRSLGLSALSLAAALVAACGGSSSSSSVDLSGTPFENRRGDATLTVDAADNVFRPKYVTVRAGTKITFDNVGRNLHNVVSVDDAFVAVDTASFRPGKKKTITFDTVGDFPYYCTLHGTPTKGMTGAIRVVK